MYHPRRVRRAAVSAAALILSVTAAAQAIELTGPATGSLDQPQINAIVRLDPAASLPLSYTTQDFLTGDPVTSYNITAYFDTGASSILLSNDTAAGWGIGTATAHDQPIFFNDVGSTGAAVFHVSVPTYFQLAPYNPNTQVDNPANFSDYKQSLGPVRLQVGPVQDDTIDPIDSAIAGLSSVDVIGMPAMKGKVIVVDPSRVDNFNLNDFLNAFDPSDPNPTFPDVELRTYIYDKTAANTFHAATQATDPGIPTTNRHVKLTMSNFAGFTSVSPAGATGPDLAANPFIGRDPVLVAHELAHNIAAPAGTTPGVKIALGNKSVEGNFLLDSGASTSFISVSKAAALGITIGFTDGVDDLGQPTKVPFLMRNGVPLDAAEQFTLPVGGISGQATLPGFYLDSLLLRTTEGNPLDDNDPAHLKFLHAPVLVNDISLSGPDPFDPAVNLNITLDGVFGMNYLIASADFSGDLTSIGDTLPSNFDWLTFDFADMNNAVLGLNLKDSVLNGSPAVPEPASLALLGLGAAALLGGRRSRR